jgi:hypothetical protein
MRPTFFPINFLLRPQTCSLNDGPYGFKEEAEMKYLVACGLGVPGALVIVWFLMSHH